MVSPRERTHERLREPNQCRLRVTVQSGVPISPGDYDHAAGRFRVTGFRPDHLGGNPFLLDLFLPREDEDLRSAFDGGRDRVNTFLDSISVAAYTRVEVVGVVALGPEWVRDGDEFEILVPGPAGERAPTPIGPENLSSRTSPAPHLSRAAALFRNALASVTPEGKLLGLASMLEVIAHQESEGKIRRSCPSCRHEWEEGRATWNWIQKTLLEMEMTTEQVKELRELRGAIAHGGGIRTRKFFRRIEAVVGALEGRALSILAQRMGTEVVNPRQIHAFDPTMILKFQARTFDFLYLGGDLEAEVVAPEARVQGGEGGQRPPEVRWGLPGLIPLKWGLNPLIWPELLAGLKA